MPVRTTAALALLSMALMAPTGPARAQAPVLCDAGITVEARFDVVAPNFRPIEYHLRITARNTYSRPITLAINVIQGRGSHFTRVQAAPQSLAARNGTATFYVGVYAPPTQEAMYNRLTAADFLPHLVATDCNRPQGRAGGTV